jgi:shikimate 5-dehydrogenase
MYPHVDEMPIPPELLTSKMAVMDAVYNPLETLLIKRARARGAKTVTGMDMLVYQAAEQERIWMGVDAPLTVMREALLKKLGKGV